MAATNAPSYGGKRSPRGGGNLSAGATVGVTPGVQGGGGAAQLAANLRATTKGGNSTTNSQPS